MKISHANAVQASDVPLESLAGNTNLSDSDKVAEVARQFEAVLLRQILQEARKSQIPGANSAESGIYDDMVNNQMADTISRSGSFGLAKSLQNQLTRQVLPHGELPNPSTKSH
ncbi:MAG TPA: rod-binding protein [Verrucomicrobiae bacterium]|jgi:Rod binding domain-containing protein|nr:rod-binding protein [Verrucomicrobiae bacterium]